MNLALGIATLAHNVYRFADVDATTTLFAKEREYDYYTYVKIVNST